MQLPLPLRGLRAAQLAVLCSMPIAAWAQFGGSLAATSDDRFRGVSLSGERPSLRATLAYDHPSGWYAGASASGMRFDGAQRVGWLGYVGATLPLASTLGADLGLVWTHVAGAARYDYGEAYAGLIAARWNLRLAFAPDYFGSGYRTAYAELNLTQPLAGSASLRLIGHVGGLARLGGHAEEQGAARYDASLGLALRTEWPDDGLEWRLVATTTSRADPYLAGYAAHRRALVLSVLYAY